MSEPKLLTFPDLIPVTVSLRIRASTLPDAMTAVYQALTSAGASGVQFGTSKFTSPPIVKIVRHGRPPILTPIDDTEEFWKRQDWKNKSCEQIAREIRCATHTVRARRLQLFGPHNPDVYRKNYSNGTLRDVYETWDWTKTDSQLGVEHGRTRERIRQIRFKLGKPPSPIKGRTGKVLKWQEAIKALEPIREQIPFKTVYQLRLMTGFPDIPIAHALRMMEIKAKHPSSKLPLRGMDWRLPNGELGIIWGRAMQSMATFRNRTKQQFATWRKTPKSPRCLEHESAYQAEVEKAQAWFKDNPANKERV